MNAVSAHLQTILTLVIGLATLMVGVWKVARFSIKILDELRSNTRISATNQQQIKEQNALIQENTDATKGLADNLTNQITMIKDTLHDHTQRIYDIERSASDDKDK